MSINKVILIGNLGSDPELRSTQSGEPVGNFRLATSDTWTDKNGQKQQATEWHNIVVWGNLAKLCEKYLFKGRQVYVEGRIQSRQWEGRDGQTKYTTEVSAQVVQFLSVNKEQKEHTKERTQDTFDDVPY